jgi:hypothetical protein
MGISRYDILKIKLITLRSSGKRASEEGARKEFQAQIMLIITWKIFPYKLRRRSRTIAKYAPSLTVSGNIASEEFFQYCILYFFQYSGNFPVILTEGCNVSGRRRSQIYFATKRQAAPPETTPRRRLPHSRNESNTPIII